MTGFLGGAYLWVKAFHIIFVIFWMAGLFLFPRYLIHHQEALGTPQAADWVKREALLKRMILSPSMGIVWMLGIALAANVGLFDGQPGIGWLHAKLLLVVALSGYNGWAVGYSRKLAAGVASLPTRRLRMLNEVPAVAAVLIVILAVVKPF
jgi:putative membrane protein